MDNTQELLDNVGVNIEQETTSFALLALDAYGCVDSSSRWRQKTQPFSARPRDQSAQALITLTPRTETPPRCTPTPA